MESCAGQRKYEVRKSGVPFTVLLALLGIMAVYIGTSSIPVVSDQTEGQYSGAAREMLESGEWLVPTNNHVPRLQKPPLVYWSLMLSMKIFGANEFAVRLPNTLMSLGWIGATYLLGVRISGPLLGALGAMILGTMFGFYILSHIIMPEPFLGLFLSLTFWCFLSAHLRPERAKIWFLAAWVFMALGCLSKGLHGALYPLMAAALCALWMKSSRKIWKELLSPWGIFLFILLWVPWHLLIEARYPGFLRDYFFNEQWGHVADSRYPPDSRQAPLIPFLFQHLAYFLPWTLFAPLAFKNWGRFSGHQKLCWTILAAWVGITFLTVLPSARQDYYTQTAWGPISLFLATGWMVPSKFQRGYVLGPLLVMTLVGLSGVLISVWLIQNPLPLPMGAEPVVQRDNIWNTLHGGFSSGVWARLLPLALTASIVLFVGGVIASYFDGRCSHVSLGAWIALMTMVPLKVSAKALVVIEDYFSLAQIAGYLHQESSALVEIVYDGQPPDAASLFFYLPERVEWVRARPDGEFASRALSIGRDAYLEEPAFLAKWHSSKRVYFILEEKDLAVWAPKLGKDGSLLDILARSGTRVLVSNLKEMALIPKNPSPRMRAASK